MTPADERPSLITGNRQMDEEHALQLQLLRGLQKSLDADETVAAAELLEHLEQFTNAHFLAEELLMRLHAYPEYEAHVAEHARFVGDLRNLRAALSGGGTEALREEADAFSRRLLAHIATTDHALGAFERSRGTTAA